MPQSTHLEFTDVYYIDPSDQSINLRGSVNVKPINIQTCSSIASFDTTTLLASGVQQHDLALFASGFDMNHASMFSYLVTKWHRNNEAELAPSDLVLNFPRQYLTSELARKIKPLPFNEIEQLSLEALIQHINRMFPGLK